MAVSNVLATGRRTEGGTRSAARYFTTVGRVLMGLLFLVFGIFGLLTSFGVVPEPAAQIPAEALAFSAALTKTGYMVPLSSGTQFVVGALLLSNRFVPLALALIAPVIVNIFLFHAFLDPKGMVIPVIIAVLEIYLAWAYREAFGPMLSPRSVPAGQ